MSIPEDAIYAEVPSARPASYAVEQMGRQARDLPGRFGERLHTLRRGRGLTQEELARACDVTAKFISEIERGNKTVSFETMAALAGALDVQMASMLLGVDDRDAKSVDDLVAGRPIEDVEKIVKAVELLLRIGR